MQSLRRELLFGRCANETSSWIRPSVLQPTMLDLGSVRAGKSFADADPPRPPQLVVGTGGVKLAKEPDVPKKINGARVTDALFLREFGFIVWDRDGANWKGRLFDRHNKQIARCDLAGTQLTCETGK